MKKILFAAIACLAILTSCDKQLVPHTGDVTGNIYGIWSLQTKTEAIQTQDGVKTNDFDYTDVHFYLSLSEFPVPTALAKKGSFTDFDLDDVDVDGSLFTFNADQKKISFKKTLWLTEGLSYSMMLSGTFDVLELTDKTLVIQQEELLGVRTVTYTYRRRE